MFTAWRRIQQGFDGLVIRINVIVRVKWMIWVTGFANAPRACRLVAMPRAVHDSGGGRRSRDARRTASTCNIRMDIG
eukprot:4803050-Pleurochrysis_carterae.AAC.1